LANLYFDINHRIKIDLQKIEVKQHTTGAGVLIAKDINYRSISWQDTQKYKRGRFLEEFLTNKQLYIMKEQSDYTAFRSRRGTSNIDLTVISDQLLRTVVEWEISEQERHRPIGHCRRQNFTLQEIRSVTESMGNKKAPGEDAITGEIYKSTIDFFNCITAMYNECLRRGVFPVR